MVDVGRLIPVPRPFNYTPTPPSAVSSSLLFFIFPTIQSANLCYIFHPPTVLPYHTFSVGLSSRYCYISPSTVPFVPPCLSSARRSRVDVLPANYLFPSVALLLLNCCTRVGCERRCLDWKRALRLVVTVVGRRRRRFFGRCVARRLSVVVVVSWERDLRSCAICSLPSFSVAPFSCFSH